jgi:serine/threonine protein kinase HipA of HipAB toxin-antitoxin module
MILSSPLSPVFVISKSKGYNKNGPFQSLILLANQMHPKGDSEAKARAFDDLIPIL